MAVITMPGMLLTGDHASRPAATAVGGGTLYACSDHDLIYQSDGATWSTWATLGGSSDLDAIITASSGQDIADALAGAAAPDSGNVFATIADLGAASFVGCKAYKTSQSKTDAALEFDTEEFDVGGPFHDNVTNNTRFVAPVTGYYGVIASSYISGSGRLEVYKNGVQQRANCGSSTGAANVHVETTVQLNATQYIEIFGIAGGARTYGDAGQTADNTTCSIWLIGV